MAPWSSEELNKIGAADELKLASARHDGTLRNPVTIWVVRCGDTGPPCGPTVQRGPHRSPEPTHNSRESFRAQRRLCLWVSDAAAGPNLCLPFSRRKRSKDCSQDSEQSQ